MEKVNIFDAIGRNKRDSFLLILLVVVIFLALVWVLSEVLGYGYCGYGIGFFVLIIYALTAYFVGDRIVLALSGAKELKHDDNPFVFNVVEGLAIAAGIPVPKIYIVEDLSPNAFATGRDPQHSAIAVTRGLLNTMNRQQLEGVLAHEISHIGNYDTRFMTLTVVLLGAIGLIAEIIVRTFIWGGGRRDSRGSGPLILIGLIFAVLAPIFAMAVKFAISRQREYLADATAAKLTRYPEGLASALEAINNQPPMTHPSDMATPLYIVNPMHKLSSGLFATHPPIEDRVKRLRGM